MEISQVYISELPAEKKMDLADDIMRLLQVREKNKEMTKDWLLFISNSNFKITAGEIYLAFKMALSREILDSKGNEIDLFPELSNNTTGKVISAYLRFKNENDLYNRAKEKLKSLKTPKIEMSETDKKQIRKDFLKSIFNEITKNGHSSDAHILFLELEKSGKINISVEEKQKMYKEQLRIYEIEEKAFLRNKFGLCSTSHIKDLMDKVTGKTPVESVANKCRSIVVSNYLKSYLTDFETFKKAF